MQRKIILLLFLLFIFLRLVNINANPPSDLSTSAGIFVDEMHNVHQVRNKILFGSWEMDKYPSTAYSPIFAYLQYIILSIIGVGLWKIKMLPIILSLLSLFLVYKSLKEYFGSSVSLLRPTPGAPRSYRGRVVPGQREGVSGYLGYRYGLVSVILLGLNYTFIMYNRLGLYENLAIFFMVLTLFFWQRALRVERSIYFFLTGVATVCVFIAKNMVFYFVVSMVICSLQYCFKKGLIVSLRFILFLLFGIVISGIIWYFGYYLPYKEEISKLGSTWFGATMSKSNFLRRFSSGNPVFLRFRFLPVTFGLAITFFLAIVYKFLKNPLKIDTLEFFIFVWFFTGLFFLTYLSYNPTRYYLPILPAVVLAASIGLVRFGYKERLNVLKPSDWSFYLTFFLGIVFLLFNFFIPYLRKFKPKWGNLIFINELSRRGDFIVSVVIGLFLVFCIAIWLYRKSARGEEEILNRRIRKIIFVIVFILIIAINLFFYSKWVLKADYSIFKANKEIGEMLPKDSLIAGQGVMAVTIGNKIRHIQAPNWYEDMKNIFYDYPITHLFLSHYARYLEWYNEHYPIVMEHAEVIAKYRIWNNDFYLFKINIPEEKKGEAYKCRKR